MKSKIYHLIITAIIFFLATSCEQFESIDQFRSLKVGEEIKNFIGITENGIDVVPKKLTGRFIVYFINDKQPAFCFDQECGRIANSVIHNGGHIISASDLKLAKLFDIKLISSTPWTFDASLIVIINAHGKIVEIYTNAKKSDVKKVVARYLNRKNN